MPEPEKKSRLAEWGSRPMTGKEKALFWLVGLVLLAGVAAVVVWAGRGIQDETKALEEKLNERYEEPISIRLTQVRNHTQETIVLDGVQRPDCDATDDGYLECDDDPQPTPVE